ncbi:MAG: S8 family serine peptidase [Myxococcales bacterium]|nr:S8 family serine peptidase [Myxococcales bacterium]
MYLGLLLLQIPIISVPINYTTYFPTEFTYTSPPEKRTTYSPSSTLRWGHITHTQTKQSWPVTVDQYAIVSITSETSTSTWTDLELSPVEALMPSIGLWRVRDARGQRDGVQLTQELQTAVSSGQLQYIVPDFGLQRQIENISIPPNDPRYPGQWYLNKINIEEAWQLSTGDSETVVVIVDNGCDKNHPDLRENLLPGLNVLDDRNDENDFNHTPDMPGNEHGTACAGIVGARGNNTEGISGVCPECSIRCVRLLGAFAPISADVRALEFALEIGAAVVSNSWSYTDNLPAPEPVVEAIERLHQEGRNGLGTVVVFAAGNENRELTEGEIATLPGVITVGATNNFDEATVFTNRGTSVDLAAPVGTLTTDISGAQGADPGDYTTSFGGTSSACPVVAGVAALLASIDPSATAQDIRQALIQSARPAPYAQPDENGHDIYYGYGIVDPEAALRTLTNTPAPSHPDDNKPPPPENSDDDDSQQDEVNPPPLSASTSSSGCSNTSHHSLLSALILAQLLVGRLWLARTKNT